MNDLEFYKKARKLCAKYMREGLRISIELGENTVVLHGFWKVNGFVSNYNKAYEWGYIERLPSQDLESLLDLFKMEFRDYLEKKNRRARND